MAPALQTEPEQLRVAPAPALEAAGKPGAPLLLDINAEPLERVERFDAHPAQAAAAPTREAFAAEGPVIATGHPALAGVQVRACSRGDSSLSRRLWVGAGGSSGASAWSLKQRLHLPHNRCTGARN